MKWVSKTGNVRSQILETIWVSNSGNASGRELYFGSWILEETKTGAVASF